MQGPEEFLPGLDIMPPIHHSNTARLLQTGLRGPHMLAFLPAVCLIAYWAGGEVLLVAVALFTPLLYAAIGGFGSLTLGDQPAERAPGYREVAQDFLEIAHHHGQTTACFQIGVSGYDEIARTLGEESADEARHFIKDRLTSALRKSDRVFQIGESRYVVFIAPGFRLKLDGLLDLASRLRAAIEQPLSLKGTTRYLYAATGIASSLNFRRNVTAETWMASGAHALADALASGPSTTRIWSDRLSHKRQSEHALREDLTDALANGQIQVHFQPQVRALSGEVVGMVATPQWDHPRRGPVQASEILRSAKDSGAIEHLGKTLLSQSLAGLRQWDLEGLSIPTVSVPFPEAAMRNPNLADQINWELDRLGLPAHRIALLIHGNAVGDSPEDVVHRNVHALADMGCRIDLDGFGTGKMPVSTLQYYPIHRLIIGQNLVKSADQSPDAKRMLAAVCAMAEKLGLETLADEIETVAHHAVMRDLGCDYVQGLLIGNAMPAADVGGWIAKHVVNADMPSVQAI
ncbi:GGDEF domain-containing phosphodiesterase [Marivita hallyeonensis]|uniref:Diguanylate cyclase/phosphodiesterase n=1 Tax=Marivita hallyeonensis TaxID=996342 RepID=A0A1M5N6H2_9RHOB|nr:GGDEF domain-containing phosphodiesterase [Marivita hallyeonensis]SHG85186.1 diguanylate cyclase/phosphodiesterase [Marivita hallyeonensis]